MSIPEYEQQPYTPTGASTGYEPVAGAPAGDPGVPPPPPPPAGYPGYPPAPGAGPNPALAGLLGFIPGVGAMYNGQLAKGIAHIAVFAIFQSLASHGPDIFGWLIAGWEFYMAFEAYQTARARREGLPLPDPFGLNNIGERFGFHPQQNPDVNNIWGQTVGKMPGAAPIREEGRAEGETAAAYSARTDATGARTGYQVDPQGNVSASAAAGYPPPSAYGAQPGSAYGASASAYGAPPVSGYGSQSSYGAPPSAYDVPPVVPPPVWGAPPPSYGVPPIPPVRSGLPAGAIWLIGLGFFALLGSLHPFAFLEGEATGGLFLMALGAFLFYRRQNTLSGMYPAGFPGARFVWARSLRGAGVVFLVGLLTFLQALHVIRWGASWPFLLIFLGVSILIERTATSGMAAGPYAGYPPPPQPPAGTQEPSVETSSPTSIVPKYTRPSNDLGDEEGR